MLHACYKATLLQRAGALLALVLLVFVLMPTQGGSENSVSTEALPQTLEEGKHFERIGNPPEPTGASHLPEILEIFNFKCPHCLTLYPHFASWAAKQRGKFLFKTIPVYWGTQTDGPVRAYYAGHYLGKGEEMKEAIFSAHFGGGLNIENRNEMAFVAEEVGIRHDDFLSAYDSFGVERKAKQARRLAKDLGVRSTPQVVIDRTYRVTLTHADGDPQRMMRIIETLIKTRP
ncbi:MAG: thiol:disulfide interchange protein DsbA/DsbL [Magnetococcales bacterium]|nr:thiol:disulfide interchange protein DsbA/DsbL [Magnetococcales bacterium]